MVGKGLGTLRATLAVALHSCSKSWKGLGTVTARLTWGHLAGSKRPVVASVKHTTTPQLDINFKKKRPVAARVFETPYFWHDFSKIMYKIVILKIIPQLPNLISNFGKKGLLLSPVCLKHLTFGIIFQNSCKNGNFENHIPTPQLKLEF